MWRNAETPEFREQMRERDADAKAELERLDGEVAKAKTKAKEACDKAKEAAEAADAACDAADAARKAYEECAGQATAAPAGGATAGGGTKGPDGPSGPGISSGGGDATQQRDPCEGQPKRKAERDGPAERKRVTVDFSMIVEAEPASKHGGDGGEKIAFELQRLAQKLEPAGDLLSARGAGLHVAGGMNGYAAGNYVAGTAGVVRGGIDATLAATDVVPDIPTSPLQAGTELLESITELAGLITGKVTDWMKRNRLMTARITYFWQEITATPYLIKECRKDQGWVCVERVWEIEIGNLRKRNGPTSKTWRPVNDVDRARMEANFRRLARAAANTIKTQTENLARWRTQHEAGPCP